MDHRPHTLAVRIAVVMATVGVCGAAGLGLFRWVESAAEVRARNRLLAERAAIAPQAVQAATSPLISAGPAVASAEQHEVEHPRLGPAQRSRTPAPASLTRAAASQDRPPLAHVVVPDDPPLRTASRTQGESPWAEFNRIAPSSSDADAVPSESEEPSDPSWEGAQAAPPAEAPVAPAVAGYVGFGGETDPAGAEPGGTEVEQAPAGKQPPGSGGGSPPPVPTEPSQPLPVPRVTLLPSSATTERGKTVQVVVRIEGGVDVSSVPFHVQHDGRVLQFERVVAGDFLSRDGSPPVVMAAPVEGANEVAVGITKTSTGPGISGSGTLLTLEFRVVSAGTTPLIFAHESVLNSRRREVPAQFHSSQLSGL